MLRGDGMQVSPRLLALCAVGAWLGSSGAFAADGVWTFDTKDRGHPTLQYKENGKSVFHVGCGHAFAIHAVYPGTAKKPDDKASITIAIAKMRMSFAGEIDSAWPDDPPNTTHFLQWDLGFKRQDPELFGKKWKRLESRLFDLLDAGQSLTISAEDRSYVLPAVNVPGWKARFKKIC